MACPYKHLININETVKMNIPKISVKKFAQRRLEWLDEITAADDVVITTRMRLSRNVMGMNFPLRLKSREANQWMERSAEAIMNSAAGKNCRHFKMAEVDELGMSVLQERRIIEGLGDTEKKDLRGVIVKSGDSACFILNDEDHLQFRSTAGGMNPQKAYKRLTTLYNSVEGKFDYSRDKNLGFYTSSPINIGSGFRLSYFCHLPALIMSGEMEQIAQKLSAASVIIRGYNGDEFYNRSNIIQFHNQATLGVSEADIIESMQHVIAETVKAEKKQRKKIVKQGNIIVKDRVSRSLAVMKNAHLLNTDELAMYHSAVRLGVDIGWIEGISGVELMRILLYGQSGHLAAITGAPLNSIEADIARALIIRDKLKLVKMV